MIKKSYLLLLIISSFLLLISCNSKDETMKNNNDEVVQDSSSNEPKEDETPKKNNDEVAQDSSSNKPKKDDGSEVKPDKSESTKPTTTNKTPQKETPSSTTKAIRLFFYEPSSDKKVYTIENVEVNDGAIVTATINSLKDNKNTNFVKLDKSVLVRSAKLDKARGTLDVDFNKSILPNNIGGGVESSFLTSIVNTLGYNLGVSKVRITINGEGYSSGHTELKDGEYFSVDYSGWTKI